jgi:hypothetical protein
MDASWAYWNTRKPLANWTNPDRPVERHLNHGRTTRNWIKPVHLVRRGRDRAVPWSGAAWTNFLDQRQLDEPRRWTNAPVQRRSVRTVRRPEP